jgi:hypothetical protein
LIAVVEPPTLLARLGSLLEIFPFASRNCTAALFVRAVVPPARVSFTVALAPVGIAPKLQLKILPAVLQIPCVVLEETSKAGSVSVRVTSPAFPGPPLLTTMVKVIKDPAFALAGEVTVIARSAIFETNGVTAFDGNDSRLLPVAFVAWTEKL